MLVKGATCGWYSNVLFPNNTVTYKRNWKHSHLFQLLIDGKWPQELQFGYSIAFQSIPISNVRGKFIGKSSVKTDIILVRKLNRSLPCDHPDIMRAA